MGIKKEENPWRIITRRDEFGPFETKGQAKVFTVKSVKYVLPKGIEYRIKQEKEHV